MVVIGGLERVLGNYQFVSFDFDRVYAIFRTLEMRIIRNRAASVNLLHGLSRTTTTLMVSVINHFNVEQTER